MVKVTTVYEDPWVVFCFIIRADSSFDFKYFKQVIGWLPRNEHISSGFLRVRLYPVVDRKSSCRCRGSGCRGRQSGGWPFWGGWRWSCSELGWEGGRGWWGRLRCWIWCRPYCWLGSGPVGNHRRNIRCLQGPPSTSGIRNPISLSSISLYDCTISLWHVNWT